MGALSAAAIPVFPYAAVAASCQPGRPTLEERIGAGAGSNVDGTRPRISGQPDSPEVSVVPRLCFSDLRIGEPIRVAGCKATRGNRAMTSRSWHAWCVNVEGPFRADPRGVKQRIRRTHAADTRREQAAFVGSSRAGILLLAPQT